MTAPASTRRPGRDLLRRSALFTLILLAFAPASAPARGTSLTVCHAGCTYDNSQLQAAILDALPGDEILLESGHTYVGTFRLPTARSCAADDPSCYITIRTGVTADGALLPETLFPPPDVRIGPADAAVLARLQSNASNVAALRTAQPGEVGVLCAAAPCVARWWRFSRLELIPEPTYQGGALIELGSNNVASDAPNGDTQNLRSEIPSHFILEQIYAHGDPLRGQFRGLYLHANDVTVKDSYVADIKSRSEGQAITITNSAGPIAIINNFLEGNTENVLSGGDGARAMQVQTVLATPPPAPTSARLSATTDLEVGQWISVLAGGTKHSTIVRSINGTDVTFDPVATLPDVPGAVRWGLVPANLTFVKNHVYKPPSWRDQIVQAPTLVDVRAVPGAGSLPAGTYAYRVVAKRQTGQKTQSYSAATPEASAALADAGAITLSWTSVPDVQAYLVYGRTPGGQNQSWTVPPTATTFTDTGSAGTSASIPSPSYWLVKNGFELKAMDGALVEGNVFDYSWKAGQVGYVVLFTVANTGGTNDSTVIRDVTFRNNRVRHGAGALQLTAQDVAGCACQVSGRLENLSVQNNVFEDIGTAWGSGIPAVAISGPGTATQPRLGPKNLTFDHNTLVTNGTNKFLNITLGRSGIDYTVENFTFTNNMARRSTYGLRYDKSPGGMQAEGLTSWTLGTSGASVFARNVIADASCSVYPDPANNYCPSSTEWENAFVDYASSDFRLRDGSRFTGAATDGSDLGADVSAVDRLTAIALSGDNRNGVEPPPPPPPPPPALALVTTFTPDGQVGVAYAALLEASGGVAPYTWTSGGQPPPGIALSSTGALSGTATSPGTFAWTAVVTDSAGAHASGALTTTIAPSPSPAAPTGLTVESVTRNQVRLAWSDNATNESAFEIQLSADGVTFRKDGTAAADITSFTSTGLKPGRTYYFRVRALAGGDSSPFSNVVSATTTARK